MSLRDAFTPAGLDLDRLGPDSLAALLGRPLRAAPGLAARLQGCFAGRRVLITGAAGSIGAALAAHLCVLPELELTLLDHHEDSLFDLQQCLDHLPRRRAAVRYVLADLRSAGKLRRVLRQARPEVVLHLAARKHVPLAELEPDEAVTVNVLATAHLARMAAECGAGVLVFPSTDKAVNPPSTYGMTKRLAEAALLALESETALRIAVVRFVNVLGTQGSVLQTFARQIAMGGPLTITDPQMTRYWMTMDEAVTLLLLAAISPQLHGLVAPDLGEPLAVVEIGRRLWRLAGHTGEPPQRITGPRPGEKPFEELHYPFETPDTVALAELTQPWVQRLACAGAGLPWRRWEAELEVLETLACEGAATALRPRVAALVAQANHAFAQARTASSA
jgi:FlaA1/EpsC-like NDP-sugar epimerase